MTTLSPEEVELRKKGLGASEIAAVAGLNPWKSALQVWREKTGKSRAKGSKRMHSRTALGSALEPLIADWYVGESCDHRNPITSVRKPTTIVHPHHSWAIATPDLIAEHQDGTVRIAEFKLVGARMRSQWDMKVPSYVVCQVIWQQIVTGIELSDIGVWFGIEEEDREIRPCPHDSEIAAGLLEVGDHFWHKHVLADIPPERSPDLEWGDYLLSKYATSAPLVMDAPPEADRWVRQYIAANAAISKAEEFRDAAKHELQWMLGFAERMDHEKFTVSWKSDRVGRVDWQAVAKEAGASASTIAQHTSVPSRRFSVRVRKGDE